MIHGTLERFCYSTPDLGEMGTFGRLYFPGTAGPVLMTVEQPWRDNAEGRSCVPEGDYICEAHDSNDFPDTWALVSEDGRVTHWQSPAAERFAILFHVGNTKDAVDGCIAPGQDLVCSGSLWGVYPSQPAMDALRRHLQGVNKWSLSIQSANVRAV